MTYINPFQFIEPPLKSLEEFSPSMLPLARQKLTEEFAAKGSIHRNGKGMDQLSAFALLAELSDSANRALHWKLWTNKPLHEFLSKPDFRNVFIIRLDLVNFSEKEWEWAAKPLTQSFEQVFEKAINESQWDVLPGALKRASSVPERFHDLMLKPVLQLLEGKLESLKYIFDQMSKKELVSKTMFDGLSFKIWPEILNELPARHQQLRNDFAQNLAEIGMLRMQQPDLYEHGQAILINAGLIQMDAAVRHRLDGRLGILLGKVKRPKRDIFKILGVGGFITVIVFIWKIMSFFGPALAPPPKYDSEGVQSAIEAKQQKGLATMDKPNFAPLQSAPLAYRQLLDSLIQKKENPATSLPADAAEPPSTGTRVFGQFAARPEVYNYAYRINLKNSSKKDMVMLMQKADSHLVEAIFIRSGEDWDFYALDEVQLLAYNGRTWSDSLSSINHEAQGRFNIPGFIDGCEFLANEKPKNGKAPIWISNFSDGRGSSFQLEFDGKKFREKIQN